MHLKHPTLPKHLVTQQKQQLISITVTPLNTRVMEYPALALRHSCHCEVNISFSYFPSVDLNIAAISFTRLIPQTIYFTVAAHH